MSEKVLPWVLNVVEIGEVASALSMFKVFAQMQRPKSDELGTLITRDVIESEAHLHLQKYFKHRQGRGNFANLHNI